MAANKIKFNLDLEKEYTPSMWTKRYETREECILTHIKIITEESDVNRSTINCELDLSYGNGDMEKFDIFHGGLPEDAPIFIYIHGGYWQELNKKLSAYCIKPIIKSGCKVIILEYNLCPTIMLSDLINQVIKAIEYLVNKYNLAKSFSVCGHSAGAHLLCYILNDENLLKLNKLKNFFFISGIYDLTELRHINSINANNLLGINDENVRFLSPNLNFSYQNLLKTKSSVQIFIYTSEFESTTFIENSNKFAEKLKSINYPNFKYKFIENCDHFDIVENLRDSNYEITKDIIDNF